MSITRFNLLSKIKLSDFFAEKRFWTYYLIKKTPTNVDNIYENQCGYCVKLGLCLSINCLAEYEVNNSKSK